MSGNNIANLLMSLFLLVPGAVAALPGDADQEISIQADSWDADRRTGVAVYRGNVIVTSGGLEMRGEELMLRFTDGELAGATLLGQPARLIQRHVSERLPTEAEARELTYDTVTAVLRLRGAARVNQGGDEFSSEDIRYDIRQERIIAGGETGSRIEVTIQPRRLPPQEPEPRP